MNKDLISGPMTHKMEAGEILCAAGEHQTDLFLVHTGKLLVFVTEGTQVTPLAYLGKGEYVGELSFFDGEPRSAHVISVEPTQLIQIPFSQIDKHIPAWLQVLAKSIISKIRESSEVFRQKGIRKKNVGTIKPLSINEQRDFYQKLVEYKKLNHLK